MGVVDEDVIVAGRDEVREWVNWVGDDGGGGGEWISRVSWLYSQAAEEQSMVYIPFITQRYLGGG